MKMRAQRKLQKWISSDYYLSSYLICKGMKVIALDDSNPRKMFVFADPDPEHREELVLNFRLGVDDEVSANELFHAQKQLQRLLRG